MAQEVSRRSLIKTVAAQVVLPVTAFSYSRILGANDRIQIGQIGCGHRAAGHRHISGTGGQSQFVRGAYASAGAGAVSPVK